MKTLTQKLCNEAAQLLKIANESKNLVEVVKCNECKYLNATDADSPWCEVWCKLVTENGYCHRASKKEKRKEENHG